PGGDTEILLRRVNDKQVGDIWLVASESLARVPSLGRSVHESWLERHMPDALTDQSILGIPLSLIVLWIASVVVPFLVIWLGARLLIRIGRGTIRDPVWRAFVDPWVTSLRMLAILVVTIAVHLSLLP